MQHLLGLAPDPLLPRQQVHAVELPVAAQPRYPQHLLVHQVRVEPLQSVAIERRMPQRVVRRP